MTLLAPFGWLGGRVLASFLSVSRWLGARVMLAAICAVLGGTYGAACGAVYGMAVGWFGFGLGPALISVAGAAAGCVAGIIGSVRDTAFSWAAGVSSGGGSRWRCSGVPLPSSGRSPGAGRIG